MPPASASPSAAKIHARLLALLAPVVADAGYDLEEITVTAAGRRSLIRVIVDSDSGVDLDAVAAVSRAMSVALDADTEGAPESADPYVLEVSSPGVDRPLIEQRHWRRAVGRLVEVPVDGAPVIGRVLETDGTGVRLEVAGIKGRPSKTREIAWGALGRGKVQVEFNRKSGVDDSSEDVDDADEDYPDEFSDFDEFSVDGTESEED